MLSFYIVLVCLGLVLGDEKDYLSDPDEVMIAQESRQYQTIVKPPVKIIKPSGVTNSHRPQYNLDSLEDKAQDRLDFDSFDTTTRKNFVKNYKSSHKIRAKETVIKDAVMKAFERKDHVGKFAQILPIIRAMSGNQRVALASLVASQVTMPPGRPLLNLEQVRSMFGKTDNTTDLMLPILLDMANLIRKSIRKQPRDIRQPPQMSRRSFNEDEEEYFDVDDTQLHINTSTEDGNGTDKHNNNYKNKQEPPTTERTSHLKSDNVTLDLAAESTNQTLAQDLPVAEKLRALSRYSDRKSAQFRRGVFPPKPVTTIRRTTTEASVSKRRPAPARKLTPTDQNKCELFTNTLCLHSEDYPTDAIVQSIRRNKAAAAALLADYREPEEGAVDGVTAAQEAKYNEQHYLVSNRRGDTANRDFASAGEAGFMCPSTVKYARPQRARATSGQWKYIVNTGEHTQTLRLEKCLKPKESCTYLTDNFKSKCVQVYNYHRLLTWDQQNGLHMDIFKVPTCCSCHIEGYSVSFPPVGQRFHETSSEHFPGEDLSSETGNHALEAVQATVQKPKFKVPPFTHKKPLESLPPFTDNQNLISGSPFSKHNDEDSVPPNPIDSYGNTYFPDSYNQATSIRTLKRPQSARNPLTQNFDEVTLPSYLEPPTPSATSSFNFIKDTSPKYKLPGTQFKRTTRPGRRPIRKKISGGPDDLVPSGTQAIEAYNSNEGHESMSAYEEPEIGQVASVNTPKPRHTIAPKLPSLTTERSTSSQSPIEKTREMLNQQIANGKRVNYNYHPIIDFFDEEKEIETEEAIDRDDSVPSYVPVVETEWKPINHPTSRTTQTNSGGRKKH